MTPALPFFVFAGLAVLCLAGVIRSGRAARRKLHLSLVVATVVSLGVALLFAEELGREYDLESAGWITPVHLTIARITTVALLLPIAGGIATLRNPRHRRLHGRLAYFAVFLVVLAAGTGVWMLLAAERIPS